MLYPHAVITLASISFITGTVAYLRLHYPKWISERVGVKCGLVGVVIVYEGENTTLSMEQIRGRDMNHVFSFVEIGNRWYLFDGDGRVSEKVLNGWHSQTWHDYGYDPEKWEIEHGESPKPIGVNLAFGDLNAMSVAAVEEGTDHSGDWREFYQFLDTLA